MDADPLAFSDEDLSRLNQANWDYDYSSRPKSTDWQREIEKLRDENERLNAEIVRLNQAVIDLTGAEMTNAVEVERLRAEVNLWRERFHRAHVSRGEWLMACPLCEPV
jgi:DNA repair exonuclease SbcCD ATPase subunit